MRTETTQPTIVSEPAGTVVVTTITGRISDDLDVVLRYLDTLDVITVTRESAERAQVVESVEMMSASLIQRVRDILNSTELQHTVAARLAGEKPVPTPRPDRMVCRHCGGPTSVAGEPCGEC